MSTLAKLMILSGADNRPPMLEKHLTKKYEEFSATEIIQAECDLKETNIILQGLPSDVYSLVNHHRFAKDIWANISGIGENNSGQQRVVKCFNCQGEGHLARQCPKLKRKRDAIWFSDTVLLVEAKGFGKVLNEEELLFLADPEVAKGPVTQTVIIDNTTNQADDLDVYDSNCNEFSTANAIRPVLYDGSVIAKETNVISIADSEETLMLEEDNR
nr:hypothetical protein [Tanacetum cinerariifolium]